MAHLLGLILVVIAAVLPQESWAQAMEPALDRFSGNWGGCEGWSSEAVAKCLINASIAEWSGWGWVLCSPDPIWSSKDPADPTASYGQGYGVHASVDTGAGCQPATAGTVTKEYACRDLSPYVGWPPMCNVPSCTAGVAGTAKVFTDSPPETFCSFGCTARIGMCMRMSEDDPLSCVTHLTGAVCTPTEHDPGGGEPEEVEDEDAVACMEQGKTLGEVNGVRVCLDRGTPGGAETIDGNTTTQEVEADGSVTKVDKTTTTITNIDGSVTVITTTVTTTNVGEPGESTSTEVDAFTGTKTQVCADRPNLPVCRSGGGGGGDGEGEGGGGEFGGSCASGFVCEGDPIQCAIAKEQHVRACQLFEDETDESLVYANALAGDDPGDAALDPANAREVGLEGMIDDGGFLAGSCLDDLVVPLWDGQSLTVPFSELCPHLEFMGMIVVAFSMLAAARIMFV